MRTKTEDRARVPAEDATSAPGPVANPYVFVHDPEPHIASVRMEVDFADPSWWPTNDGTDGPATKPIPSFWTVNGEPMDGVLHIGNPSGLHARQAVAMAALREHLHTAAERAFLELQRQMIDAGYAAGF